MIKTFKYTTDLKETYGVSQLGLKKNDTFKLIDTKLACIKKTSDTLNVYCYEYTINIPNEGCFVMDEEEWSYLIMYSEFVDSE